LEKPELRWKYARTKIDFSIALASPDELIIPITVNINELNGPTCH
jgi:hypothetical protein